MSATYVTKQDDDDENGLCDNGKSKLTVGTFSKKEKSRNSYARA